jgi:endonuclease/exonuclease/phosphatase (EEP) superfamily protein YafD
MKIFKVALYLVTCLLALISIIISIGSALCKFADLSETSIIQIFGYLSYYWTLILSGFVFLFFLLLSNLRVALSYLVIMAAFAFLLNDFSLSPITRTIPKYTDNYNKVKVAAYNVKFYKYGLDKISKLIKGSDIDILLLSESALAKEKLDWLKNSLPEYYVATDGGQDLSLLSRYPVMNYKIIELPTYPASFSEGNDIEKLKSGGIHRSFVHAVVDINGINVNILSLRLIAGRPKDKTLTEKIKWGRYLISAQNQELKVFLNYLSTLKGPVIFGGDLNSPPNSRIIHNIKHYVDDSCLDINTFGSFTFRTLFPTARLDYVFHSKGLIVKDSKVINCPLSDHFLVKFEFLIPKTSPAVVSKN